jgi:hypothetical protein
VRLGLLNAGEAQDLIVYVLHPLSRFEVANYRNVFIPTNLDVIDDTRNHFGEFYARLFDATMASAGAPAVVTEYAWATSSCDPCPTPPLSQSELSTLGLDAMPSAPIGVPTGVSPWQGQGRPPYGGYGMRSMVVTRMHTRYNRATLTEDLVFREASGIVGGREFAVDANGGIEHGAQPSGTNNFQARYAIRHEWTGPITCASPRRGVWGGPPGGQRPQPIAARDLASVSRTSEFSLPSHVRTPTPGVNLNARLILPTPPPIASAQSTTTGATATSPAARRGCACRTTPTRAQTKAAAIGLIAFALACGTYTWRRRRRDR